MCLFDKKRPAPLLFCERRTPLAKICPKIARQRQAYLIMCWTKFWSSGHWGGGVWPFSFSRHEKKPNVGVVVYWSSNFFCWFFCGGFLRFSVIFDTICIFWIMDWSIMFIVILIYRADKNSLLSIAFLAQSVEYSTLNRMVGGSTPPEGYYFLRVYVFCKNV